MRLSTIAVDDREVPAVLVPGRGLALLSDVDPSLPGSLLGLLVQGLPPGLQAAAASLPENRLVDPRAVSYGPLYRRPRKVLGIGLNYRAHAADLAAPVPDEPASFLKGDHTIIGSEDVIQLPAQSQRVTAEAELGLIFGRECRDVNEADALQYLAGVSLILDQTAEDILQRNPRFLTRAKNFPGFFSFGPELVTIDEVLSTFRSLGEITVATIKNGQVQASATVAEMIFSLPYLISFHSKVMPLYPGDIISTGTPGATVIADGDLVEARIEGIGTLRNRVRRAS
jgi:2-keto-4-pentenoate hydratase/2-oxohepta-3-ene-1,7-dioic acid hydratase in catechol pathway